LIGRFHFITVTFTLLLSILVIFEQTSLADIAPKNAQQAGAQQPNARGFQIDGETVFEQACFSCHGTGFYGAPVIGDQFAWEERLTRGETELIENTLQGLNSMPARGGCVQCSDAEIQAAVRYLINY
jgi:cytochrome c5